MEGVAYGLFYIRVDSLELLDYGGSRLASEAENNPTTTDARSPKQTSDQHLSILGFVLKARRREKTRFIRQKLLLNKVEFFRRGNFFYKKTKGTGIFEESEEIDKNFMCLLLLASAHIFCLFINHTGAQIEAQQNILFEILPIFIFQRGSPLRR